MKIQKLYDHIYDWVIRYGPRLVIGLFVLIIGLWLINLILRKSHSRLHKQGADPSFRPFLQSVIAVGLRILLIMGVMEIVGIQLTLFTALVGAFGVAAGLALSGTLQNFASGVLILLLKPFAVGDNILTQGLEGTVTSIEIFYTIVKTFDNRSVIAPNSTLSNNVIINLSREGSRRLDIMLKFTNNIDLRQVRQVINAALDKCDSALKAPERRIGVGEIQPDGYIVEVNVWVNAHGFHDSKLAIQEVILQDVKDAGIKIPGM